MTVNKIKNIFNNATLTTKSAFNYSIIKRTFRWQKTHIINTPDNYEAQGVGINELVQSC